MEKKTKAGWATSEFYLMLVAVVLNAIMGSGLIEDMPEAVRIVSLVLTVLGALGYGVARTIAKK